MNYYAYSIINRHAHFFLRLFVTVRCLSANNIVPSIAGNLISFVRDQAKSGLLACARNRLVPKKEL